MNGASVALFVVVDIDFWKFVPTSKEGEEEERGGNTDEKGEPPPLLKKYMVTKQQQREGNPRKVLLAFNVNVAYRRGTS